jgi:hypothetical protein
MVDLTQGLVPQRTREEEGNTDILNEILTELKRLNSYMVLITDTIIKEEDLINENENVGP